MGHDKSIEMLANMRAGTYSCGGQPRLRAAIGGGKHAGICALHGSLQAVDLHRTSVALVLYRQRIDIIFTCTCVCFFIFVERPLGHWRGPSPDPSRGPSPDPWRGHSLGPWRGPSLGPWRGRPFWKRGALVGCALLLEKGCSCWLCTPFVKRGAAVGCAPLLEKGCSCWLRTTFVKNRFSGYQDIEDAKLTNT